MWVANPAPRYSSPYSRGVMSTWTSPHSSVGMSASRRSISASPVETIWITAAWPASRSRSTAAISAGGFMAGVRWIKKSCFAPLEGRTGGGFGLAVERPGLAGDIGGLQRGVEVVVDDLECARIGIIDADLLGREVVVDQLVFDP